jgi:anti-sigma factor RsiW
MTQPHFHPTDALPAECAAIQNDLPDYLEGALPSAEHEAVASHLAACHTCRTELELLHIMALALAHTERPAPIAAMRERLLARIEAEAVIERFALIRRRLGDSGNAIQVSKTEAYRAALPVSPLSNSASGAIECVTIRRSMPAPRISTICRRVYRG